MSYSIDEVMNAAPVVPVLVIEKLEHAVPLAKALVEGGLRVLEITLRTDCALDAIRAMKDAVPEAIVGAGTVNTPELLDAAVAAGSDFLVSPGSTPALIDKALSQNVPLLPGVNSPSEVMALLERGVSRLKFFPAEAAGGIPMLKSIGGPLPQAIFCPTGGITLEKAKQYLALDNVACVGGSWLAPANLMAEGRWDDIKALAAEAAALAK
jgi:2-dehydro-3-deoxyphosphogluconate aldolase/(4S)-4-hydroxy-2-oxoglutarate aldolase